MKDVAECVIQLKMNEGPSFSFLSEPSQRNPIGTFNSFEGDSNNYLKEIQGPKPFRAGNSRMSDKLQIVLLLQAAQIQRLTSMLNSFQSKFQQIPTSSKDMPQPISSQNELRNSHKGALLRNKMMNESLQSQGQSSMGDISMGSVTDLGLYLQKLQGKYKRALRYVQEHAAAREQLESAYLQTKEELEKTQKNFEAFKVSSIREYQLLREQLDNSKRDQISFQIKQIRSEKQKLLAIIKKERAQLQLERISQNSRLQQERDRLSLARNQIQRLSTENEQYRKNIERAELKYRELMNQKQNAAILSSLQIERLNSVIKEKTIRLKDIQASFNEQTAANLQQAGLLKRELQRFRERNNQLQQEVRNQHQQASLLTKEIELLASQIREMQVGSQQLITEKKMKESDLHRQLQKLSQAFSTSEANYQQKIEEYRQSSGQLSRQLSQTKSQLIKLEQQSKQQEFKAVLKTKQLQERMAILSRQNNNFRDHLQRIQEEMMSNNMREHQKMKKEQQKLVTQNNRLFDLQDLHEKDVLQINHLSSRIMQMEQIIDNYQLKLRQQSAIEVEISAQNESLRAALAQAQKSKNNIIKSRSFEQLYQQIETLCSSVRQKETYIQTLEQQISKLTQSAAKNLKETLQIRGNLNELLKLFQNFETQRKQDQHILMDEIRRLFVGEANLIEDLKKSQQQVFLKMQIQHPLVQQYQSRLISSKDNEIEALRERVNFLQTESFERGNLQDIIAKVIALTKENSELKAAFAVKELEMTNLYQQYQRINTQIEEQKSNFKRRLQEKGQIQKRVRQQLEQANQKLLSESQGYIKYQSAKFELESLKEYSERELSGRDQLIRELKAALKLKNELNIQTSSAVEIEIHKNSNLHQEINRLKNLLNKQDYEKTSVLEIKRQEIQQLKTQVQNLQEINRNLERDQIKLVNANSALKQENEHLKEQNQNQTRMPMKNKEEPSSKVQICKQCNRLHIQISRIQLERSNILEQLHILKAENDALQQQEERRKRALEYSQKIPILNAEFNRLEQVIQNLKQKNNQLLISNHEFEIELQKQQHNKQKLVALNQEILRLQAQNIDLVEEVNVYRLEFSQEANQEQQLQQSYSLLVLLFVEIQALRSRVQLKEKELQQLNKKYLRL